MQKIKSRLWEMEKSNSLISCYCILPSSPSCFEQKDYQSNSQPNYPRATVASHLGLPMGVFRKLYDKAGPQPGLFEVVYFKHDSQRCWQGKAVTGLKPMIMITPRMDSQAVQASFSSSLSELLEGSFWVLSPLLLPHLVQLKSFFAWPLHTFSCGMNW